MSVSEKMPGRLARALATRGGTAEPEAALLIEHREALIYLLCEAAELEHTIMCQYLFAAFSLKQRAGEGLTEEQLGAARRWSKHISHVASEEMLHLALVHNLLSAIGAAPHFGRPNLPQPARHYPPGIELTLMPFGEPALQHFMFLERPEGMQLEDAEGLERALDLARPVMAAGDIVPQPQDFATVGHLYRSIELGLARLVEKFGEAGLFVGPPEAQATASHFSWPELVAVTDLASAQQAIDTILEQGEGARGDWQDAHFGQFVAILDEYRQMKQEDPAFHPARPVLPANVRPCEHADGVPLIGDPLTARCVDLFNVGYEILLQMLERYFAHTDESETQLATLADATLAIMLRILKPLGGLISTLPVGPEHPGRTGGASFELFYENDFLMPHRGAAWALLEERLREAADFCEHIRKDAGDALGSELTPILGAFGDVADSLAAHFSDWGAISRYVPASDAGSPPTGEVLEVLVRDAEGMARSVAGAQTTDGEGRSVAGVFAATLRLLMRAVEEARGDPDSRSATEGARLASRLLGSVLRPLHAGLCAGAGAGLDADAPGSEDPRAVDRGPLEVGGGSVEEQLWHLAQEATELRAGMSAGSKWSSQMQEATAALQDLAVGLAAEDGAARVTRLSELQARLPVAIQIATDGPYLVTNATAMHSWLGEALGTRPQMALCRCGKSKIKPLCDGTHATVGFKGEKDPKRVPDRRDTYVGLQVTILDDRGTCQHSGLCTDRLASVFHSGEEPFVTPSGARMDELINAVRDCPSGALSYAIDGVEARGTVDHHGTREAAIEVTKDGPYRVTGGIPLIDGDGAEQARNELSSREHYALCRCGQSQNKPFCSGMHWYVDFQDPVVASGQEPSMFQWCGGLPALTRMTRLFFERYVPADELLATLFADTPNGHPERLAKWLAEAFGGPPGGDGLGGPESMIPWSAGEPLSEEARARWVALLLRSAREGGMPQDPTFSSAFTAFIEWGSRAALEASLPGASPTAEASVPKWGWGCAGPPSTRDAAPAPEAAESEPLLPGDAEAVLFSKHVRALFRERDQKSMSFVFDLWSYGDVKANAEGILRRLQDGTMPCDGAWPPEKIAVFQRWAESDMPD